MELLLEEEDEEEDEEEEEETWGLTLAVSLPPPLSVEGPVAVGSFLCAGWASVAVAVVLGVVPPLLLFQGWWLMRAAEPPLPSPCCCSDGAGGPCVRVGDSRVRWKEEQEEEAQD